MSAAPQPAPRGAAAERFDPPLRRRAWRVARRLTRDGFLADARARWQGEAGSFDRLLWHGGLHLNGRPLPLGLGLAGEPADASASVPDVVEAGSFVTAWGFRREPEPVSFTPDRILLFKDAPTMQEMGQDFSYFMQRSVVGAPGMSSEAEEYYRGVFKKVYESDEWQGYMKKKALRGEFMTGSELQSYWKENNDRHRDMLKKIGEI